MPPTAYPLTWPLSQKRTTQRQRAAFGTRASPWDDRYVGKQKVTIAKALDRLSGELNRLRVSQQIISTNVPLRLDGWPRSEIREPADPGAAVYFTFKGRPHVLACDKWDRVADNLVAIAKHVEALRGQDRWGVGTLEQAFAGYLALPATTRRPWREVLGISDGVRVTVDSLREQYRRLARTRHPDRGGTDAAMAELNDALTEALREVER